MMELFKPNGHFTDAGIAALANGELNELERLEASEHMSFCDECLTHYLAALDGTELLAPSQPMRGPVMRRIKTKARKIMFSRYATVAAAAALAVGMTSSGLLSTIAGFAGGILQRRDTEKTPDEPTTAVVEQAVEEPRQPLGTRFDNFLAGINSSLHDWMDAGEAPVQAEEEETEPSEREQKESLFGDKKDNNDK